MILRITALLSFVVLLMNSVHAREFDSCCRLHDYRTIEELGREYKNLRQNAGSACCNRFNSGLMQALTVLRDSLQPGTSVKRVIKLMGRPDLRRKSRYGAVEPAPGSKLLIYNWRGNHDFLYFVVRRNRVVRCEWYNAWE